MPGRSRGPSAGPAETTKAAAPNNRFAAGETASSLEDAAAQDLHGQRDVVPGFAASQDGPTLLLAANAAGGCKLKPMSLAIQKTLGPHESC